MKTLRWWIELLETLLVLNIICGFIWLWFNLKWLLEKYC
jgi:hypothetical protein